MSTIQEIMQRVTDLPMLSGVAHRLLTIVGGDDHSLKDVVSVVENDPSLTARVLRVANSAALYRGKEITTLSRAVANLGEKMIVGIAIESCTAQVYRKPLEGYCSPEGELWDHSLLSAIASREIAGYAKNSTLSDLAFTAGLLHDIGKAVISEYLKDDAEKMVQWFDAGKVTDFLQAETDVLGTNHAEVGKQLGEHWKLPGPILCSIEHHHNPAHAPDEYKSLVYIVHLGDITAQLGGLGTGSDSLGYTLDDGYTNYVNLGSKDLIQIMFNIQEEFRRTKESVFSGEDVNQ